MIMEEHNCLDPLFGGCVIDNEQLTFRIIDLQASCGQRWAIATLLIASLPLFVKFNSGTTASITE